MMGFTSSAGTAYFCARTGNACYKSEIPEIETEVTSYLTENSENRRLPIHTKSE